MKLWLLIGAGIVLIGAFGGTYLKGQEAGRDACIAEYAKKEQEKELALQAQELEAQKDFDHTITLLRSRNQQRVKEFERRENDYAHRIGELSRELYDQRQEQSALEEELAGRGASLADQRCARDSSGLRRLYQNVFERSAIPPENAKSSE